MSYLIVGEVHTIVETNHSGWAARNRTLRKRVRRTLSDITLWDLLPAHCFLWRFLLLGCLPALVSLSLSLFLFRFCLSRRWCRTGFVNHVVRIARIIPRSCGIIKEVLLGTVNPSFMEICILPHPPPTPSSSGVWGSKSEVEDGGWSVWTVLIRTLSTMVNPISKVWCLMLRLCLLPDENTATTSLYGIMQDIWLRLIAAIRSRWTHCEK